MNTGTLVAGPLSKIGRAELAQIPVPQATATHRPVPHHEIVEALVETLSFRHIAVVNEEYAASSDGMKMFGVRWHCDTIGGPIVPPPARHLFVLPGWTHPASSSLWRDR
jgi:hypothetical protein